MVSIPPGTYSLGAGGMYPEELPIRNISTNGFSIDATLVTNAEYKRFVDATGYVTFAERPPPTAQDPPAGSACFRPASNAKVVTDRWVYVPGANWRHPEGPRSTINGKMNYPVVHVTIEDAEAYAKWMGSDLPTQDEWEIAARGGLVNKTYDWGDTLTPGGKWLANVYQGDFPKKDLGLDGYKSLSPVGVFPPNGYHLYDMTGNVWELTADQAPTDPASGQPCHWAKGGSFLCAANYCARYRPASRIPINDDSSTENVGFRCVVRGRALYSVTPWLNQKRTLIGLPRQVRRQG